MARAKTSPTAEKGRLPRDQVYHIERFYGPKWDEYEAKMEQLRQAIAESELPDEVKHEMLDRTDQLIALEKINACYASYEKLEAETVTDQKTGNTRRRFKPKRPLRTLGPAAIWLGEPAARDDGVESKVIYSEVPRGSNIVFGQNRRVMQVKISEWVRKADQEAFEEANPEIMRRGAEDLDNEDDDGTEGSDF